MDKVNINVQGNEDTHVDVNILLGKSYEYNDLLDQLNTLQKLFDLTPEDNTEERLRISEKINELTSQIEQFKRDVIQLAETFDKLEINTGRLIQAKEFFDKGEIGEARALLNDANEEIESEEKQLWAKREQYETEIKPKLIAKSEERLIQALLTQTDYTNLTWFEDTCNYFERSIESYPNKTNVFRYAFFLQKHTQFEKAEKYYVQYLTDFKSKIAEDEYATILNNLAALHEAQNNFNEALKKYEEALEINRQLAKTNPNSYLLNLAITLSNLAHLHQNQNKFDEAFKEYELSLQIFRQLNEMNPDTYLPYLSNTLSNLATLHQDQNKFDEAFKEYQEALQIHRQLAKINPNAYLSEVARILNSLATLYQAQNKFDKALREYEEALEIYRQLAQTNPNTYLTDVAITLNNLATLHENQNKFDEAFKEYEEALQIRRQLAKINPNAYLSTVAMTLNNFAGWYLVHKEYKKVLQMAEESTEIYRELVSKNFQTYFLYLAGNLTNLAMFYLTEIRLRKKSIEYGIEGMIIVLPYIDKIPFAQEIYMKAWFILLDWQLSDEEISQMIEEKMKENEMDKA